MTNRFDSRKKHASVNEPFPHREFVRASVQVQATRYFQPKHHASALIVSWSTCLTRCRMA
ncbi:hypothetical protein BGV72_18980 [Burkholderia ubonensis]|uniref:Uncharacterized protein n=1 Tax=Burkholderia ubonensis TaxID=101571 RepID=A0AAU8UBG5_9BURK|nr:hypothetical protein WK67_12345 [Burkholderia ubonensis]OJA75904.1 hypothetical protein BGV72_18980 [Burkholderia ubonensis]